MRSGHHKTLLFWILCSFLAIPYRTVAFGSKQSDTTVTKLPQWIAKEKIRSGYLYARNNTKYAALMRAHGLNTVILKGPFQYKGRLADTLRKCRLWAQACKNEKLHLFLAYNWQPDLKSFSYRRVVYSNGASGIAPCPRDHKYWQSYLMPLGRIIAELSLESDLQVDGIFLDCELYDSGTPSAYKVMRRERPAGPWEEVATAVVSEATLVEQPKGKELEYRIIAVNKAGDGEPSNTAMVVL